MCDCGMETCDSTQPTSGKGAEISEGAWQFEVHMPSGHTVGCMFTDDQLSALKNPEVAVGQMPLMIRVNGSMVDSGAKLVVSYHPPEEIMQATAKAAEDAAVARAVIAMAPSRQDDEQ